MSKRNNTKDQPVVITWQDAEAEIGWEARGEDSIVEECLVQSIGWIVASNAMTVMLIADKDGDNGNSNRGIRIPVSCIKSIHTLNLGRKTAL